MLCKSNGDGVPPIIRGLIMLEVFLVFIGAGFGGVLRFVLGSMVYSYTGRYFPYGTLAINLTGCFLIGLMYITITQKFPNLSTYLSALIIVGILGGYTTFSSFSLETLRLIQDGKPLYALINIFVSVILGLILTYLGIKVGQLFCK